MDKTENPARSAGLFDYEKDVELCYRAGQLMSAVAGIAADSVEDIADDAISNGVIGLHKYRQILKTRIRGHRERILAALANPSPWKEIGAGEIPKDRELCWVTIVCDDPRSPFVQQAYFNDPPQTGVAWWRRSKAPGSPNIEVYFSGKVVAWRSKEPLPAPYQPATGEGRRGRRVGGNK